MQINGQTFAHILAILENEFDWPMLSGALRLAYCMLHTACFIQHATRCMLHVALCLQHVACCMQHVATCFMQHAAYRILGLISAVGSPRLCAVAIMRTSAPVNRPALSLRCFRSVDGFLHQHFGIPEHPRPRQQQARFRVHFRVCLPLLLRPMPARAVRLQHSPAWIGEPKDPL